MNYGVFDCDYEAKVLMDRDYEIRSCLKEIAGNEIYDNQDRLDRNALSKLIFHDNEIRARVNALIHSAVRKRVFEWLKEGSRNIFVETAIAWESKLLESADAVWKVTASKEERIKRVIKRDNRQRDRILRIIEVQGEEERKLREAGVRTYEIANSGNDDIMERISQLIGKIDIAECK